MNVYIILNPSSILLFECVFILYYVWIEIAFLLCLCINFCSNISNIYFSLFIWEAGTGSWGQRQREDFFFFCWLIPQMPGVTSTGMGLCVCLCVCVCMCVYKTWKYTNESNES